jgi:hypothetical protein
VHAGDMDADKARLRAFSSCQLCHAK